MGFLQSYDFHFIVGGGSAGSRRPRQTGLFPLNPGTPGCSCWKAGRAGLPVGTCTSTCRPRWTLPDRPNKFYGTGATNPKARRPGPERARRGFYHARGQGTSAGFPAASTG